MAQKNLIGENGGERKINPSANPELNIKVYFTLIKVKKLWNTYKMHMKTLNNLISRIRNHILVVKGQKIDLLSIIMCFDNVTNKQSAPSFAKTTLSFFLIEERLLREITM